MTWFLPGEVKKNMNRRVIAGASQQQQQKRLNPLSKLESGSEVRRLILQREPSTEREREREREKERVWVCPVHRNCFIQNSRSHFVPWLSPLIDVRKLPVAPSFRTSFGGWERKISLGLLHPCPREKNLILVVNVNDVTWCHNLK